MTSTKEKPSRGLFILRKASAFVFPFVFFSYLFGIELSMPLNDPDIFWHIKTGEYIMQQKEVPDVDPFAYTTPRPLSENQKIGLRAQWLGQVFFYSAYNAKGLFGVLLLRNLLIILPSVILCVWLIRRGAGVFTSLALVSFTAINYTIQLFYSFERPQGLSFSLVLVVVLLLERLREKCYSGGESGGRDFSFFALPVVMALWSNIHAGFIVGIFLVVFYLVGEAARIIYQKIRKTEGLRIRPVFFLICALAVAATVLNPNTYKLFLTYTSGMLTLFVKNTSNAFTGGQSGSWVKDVVLEYKPLIYFYNTLGYKWLIFYWVFTALIYAFMFFKYWTRRSIDLAEFLSLSFLVFFANYHARGLMFSLSVMPFYLVKTMLELRRPEVKFRLAVKGVVTCVLVLSIAFCTYTYKNTPNLLVPGVARTLVTAWYPMPMINFIKENRIAPPMYNYYTWGGFLIWGLYPQYQVFIDGRALDNTVNRTADDMLKIMPGWDSKIEAYGINFIVIPLIFRESGHIIPLGPALVTHDKWKLIYLRNNAAIFVKDVPRNKDLIYKYNIKKQHVFTEIIKIENIMISANPYHPVYNIAKADALVALKKYKEAKAIYERFPRDAAFRLKKLEEMGY